MAQAKATMMFKMAKELVDVPRNQLTPTSGTRGHDKNLIPQTRTKIYQHSYFPDTIRIWNDLTQAAVGSTTLDRFRSQLCKARLGNNTKDCF